MLHVKNLTVTLNGNRILHDLSFDLKKGENLAVIGPNGSGKTVLLKTLLGMFPYKGTIEWHEKPRIGYVPQKIEADRHLPLNFENLFAAKADILKLSPREVKETTETVHIDTRILKTPVGHLSGGEFQRALIGFALLGSPSLLLFDEPTASIDVSHEQQIYETLHELQEKYNLTVIVVSHDLSFVYRYATKVLCLNEEMLCFGEPQDILNTETLKSLFGGNVKYYHHLEHGPRETNK